MTYLDKSMRGKAQIMRRTASIYKRGELSGVIDFIAKEFNLDNADARLIEAIKWVTNN